MRHLGRPGSAIAFLHGEAVMRSIPLAGLAAWCLMLPAGGASAAEMKLIPSDTHINLTVYAMGLFPQNGHFSNFTGTLSIDPGHPESCHVAMQVQVASLAMPTETATRTALGPTVLDAVHFPTLAYQGDCKPASTAGQLTLHGVTRPLTLTATRDANHIAASGVLRRQDYDIRGLPGLIGSMIHIVFSVDLPPDLAAIFPR
jgi:polyisoprenoid-binding protein YceI